MFRKSLVKPHRGLAVVLGCLFLLLAWKILALAMGKELVLPSPEKVALSILTLYPSQEFQTALAATFLRGLFAFGISSFLGILFGLASGLYPRFASALSPTLTVIRATPVLALVLIALLWFPSDLVPVFSAFLMAFPIMVTSAAEGVHATDPKLLEMASLFRVPPKHILFRLRLPSAAPHLIAGAKNALGLSWKVVVAGEILSQPRLALGTGMQASRLELETATVFAWAFAAIFLCAITEALFSLAVKGVHKHGF